MGTQRLSMSQRLPMPIGLLCSRNGTNGSALRCSVSLRCVHGFRLWSPFPYFYTICARWQRSSVCVCVRFGAARMTCDHVDCSLLCFLFESVQFPIFIEFAVSACASRPFLANAI